VPPDRPGPLEEDEIWSEPRAPKMIAPPPSRKGRDLEGAPHASCKLYAGGKAPRSFSITQTTSFRAQAIHVGFSAGQSRHRKMPSGRQVEVLGVETDTPKIEARFFHRQKEAKKQ